MTNGKVRTFVSFCVWVLHGSVLGYFIDYTEGKQFSLPARQYISIYALSHILKKKPEDVQEDPALMQVIIERGEAVTVDWAVSIIRIVIPLALPVVSADCVHGFERFNLQNAQSGSCERPAKVTLCTKVASTLPQEPRSVGGPYPWAWG
jgi:hypothetical protein